MNNRFLLLVWVFSCATVLRGQVGINTTDPKAQLEIKSSNEAAPTNTDGLIIPKVDAFPAINPTAAQQGMMVYLTTTAGSNAPGFYYWDNVTATWIGVGKNTANAWGLTGNSGTSVATNFIGTTDNQDVVFKRNNQFAGILNTSLNNTFYGVGAGDATVTGTSNTFIGRETGSINTSGQQNVFIGRRAGFNNITGSDNIFIGNGSGLLNNSLRNVGIGSFSGNQVTTGGNNTFVGFSSGSGTTSGLTNTFIGSGSGTINSTGAQNVCVGFNSSVATNNLNNAIAVGTFAQVAASNSMVLGSINGINGAVASTAVAIGATTPNAALEVASTNRGVLIPRVSLTAANVQAPVVNPQGGALPESTLVYNITTAGVSPNNVYPGFYYWDSTRWVRFDVNGENNPKYYTAVGTTNINSGTSFTPMSQMSLTFTPKDDVVLVNFSAAGRRSDDACQNNAIFFQILLNGVPVTGWQTASKQGIVDIPFATDDITIWDTNFTYPVAVTIGSAQTISIEWASPNCSMLNSPTGPLTAFGSVFKSYRSLTVIDPNGGGGIVGSPPVTTNQWALNGNSGTNSVTNFVGTSDAQPLVLKANNTEGIRINAIGNVGMGTANPLDKLHITGNIRMVDGNQAAGKVLTSDANGTATWQNASDNAWGITGNSAISDVTNFIGTTVAADVVFKRNNIEAGRLDASNTSFGVSSLVSNTSGFLNSAYGRLALNANTTGFLNVAFGDSSLLSNITGNNNSAYGVNALKTNDSGSNNVAVGRSALEANVSGNQNVGIGTNTLFANTTGLNNTAVGIQSLLGNTIGQNNVAFGLSSLRTNTTGNNNTAIGANSDVATAGLTNATAIGANAEVAASNSLVLGSINGVNGATASTNVGIGTAAPIRALHVSTGSSGGTPLASSDIVLESNGPTYQHFLTPSTSETGLLFGSNLNTIHSGIIANNTGNTLGLIFRTGGNTNRMSITSAGDVGIGTLAPGGQFELSLNEGRKPISNTWTIPSDARLKEVHGAYEKGLSEIRRLRTVRYHYKNTDKKTFDPKVLSKEAYGFLAQEVQPLFPEAVGTDADGYLNFDLHPILIASVNAIKELDAQNQKLQQENQALKNQLTAQQQKLDYILLEIEKIKNK